VYTTSATPTTGASVYYDEECAEEAVGTVSAYSASTTVSHTTRILQILADSTTGKRNIAVVNDLGSITGTSITAKFCLLLDASYEESSSTFQVTSTNGGQVTVSAGLTTNVSAVLDKASASGALESGNLYLEYRERLSSYVGVLGSASTISEAAAILGAAVPENPLSLAMYYALQAAEGTIVYFTAVRTEDVAGYTEALDFLTRYPAVYSIVPATEDTDIIKACAGSVESISEDVTSKVRRSLWYGLDTDAQPDLYTGIGEFTPGVGSALSKVKFTESNVFVKYPVQTGDVLMCGSVRCVIRSTNLVNTANVELPSGATITAGSHIFTLVRENPTNEQLVQDIVSRRPTQSFRCQCVWTDGLLYNGEQVHNFCAAAAAAGMRAGELCWRPLSNLGYSFMTLSESHGFSMSQLKELGANGIWIIANNNDNLPINMKAITTAVANNVNTDNESVVSNADEVALALCKVGEGLVGSSNISDTLLALLSDSISTILDYRTSNSTSSAVGNQLLSYEVEQIYQDPANLDNVYADITLEPPKPFNRFHMTMQVI